MLCLADLAVGVLMFLASHCHHVKHGFRCHSIVAAGLMSTGDASSQPISSPSLSDKHDCAIQDVKACRTLN